jgi:hypothetical protein
MSEPRLDWGTASVSDGELAVGIDGDVSKPWKNAFETTAKLLGHGEWMDVALKKQRVRVTGVSPGSEDKLRHFLEGVVQQANADCFEDEDEGEAQNSEAEAQEREQDAENDEREADSEMTERFRSFSGQGD